MVKLEEASAGGQRGSEVPREKNTVSAAEARDVEAAEKKPQVLFGRKVADTPEAGTVSAKEGVQLNNVRETTSSDQSKASASPTMSATTFDVGVTAEKKLMSSNVMANTPSPTLKIIPQQTEVTGPTLTPTTKQFDTEAKAKPVDKMTVKATPNTESATVNLNPDVQKAGSVSVKPETKKFQIDSVTPNSKQLKTEATPDSEKFKADATPTTKTYAAEATAGSKSMDVPAAPRQETFDSIKLKPKEKTMKTVITSTSKKIQSEIASRSASANFHVKAAPTKIDIRIERAPAQVMKLNATQDGKQVTNFNVTKPGQQDQGQTQGSQANNATTGASASGNNQTAAGGSTSDEPIVGADGETPAPNIPNIIVPNPAPKDVSLDPEVADDGAAALKPPMEYRISAKVVAKLQIPSSTTCGAVVDALSKDKLSSDIINAGDLREDSKVEIMGATCLGESGGDAEAALLVGKSREFLGTSTTSGSSGAMKKVKAVKKMEEALSKLEQVDIEKNVGAAVDVVVPTAPVKTGDEGTKNAERGTTTNSGTTDDESTKLNELARVFSSGEESTTEITRQQEEVKKLQAASVEFNMELKSLGASPADAGPKILLSQFTDAIKTGLADSPEIAATGATLDEKDIEATPKIAQQKIGASSYLAYTYSFADRNGNCENPSTQMTIPGLASQLSHCLSASNALNGKFLRVERDHLYPAGCYMYQPVVQVGQGHLFMYLNLQPKDIQSSAARPERARLVCQEQRDVTNFNAASVPPLPFFDPCTIVYPMGKDSGAKVLGLTETCARKKATDPSYESPDGLLPNTNENPPDRIIGATVSEDFYHSERGLCRAINGAPLAYRQIPILTSDKTATCNSNAGCLDFQGDADAATKVDDTFARRTCSADKNCVGYVARPGGLFPVPEKEKPENQAAIFFFFGGKRDETLIMGGGDVFSFFSDSDKESGSRKTWLHNFRSAYASKVWPHPEPECRIRASPVVAPPVTAAP
ncbi:unnamed protein product [Amoebophrya sp. A120]|nr:unnamed protein product [Amoebophrya sp. A120]|eukprot:GSA120T00012145001.1